MVTCKHAIDHTEFLLFTNCDTSLKTHIYTQTNTNTKTHKDKHTYTNIRTHTLLISPTHTPIPSPTAHHTNTYKYIHTQIQTLGRAHTCKKTFSTVSWDIEDTKKKRKRKGLCCVNRPDNKLEVRLYFRMSQNAATKLSVPSQFPLSVPSLLTNK